jgi:hypothetical protein
MKNKIIKIIMNLMISGTTFAADNLFPIAPTSPAQANWHLSVRGALEEHNQLRFERSETFEETVGSQKFAVDLPENLKQVLKTHTKSNEFSKKEVVQPLFKLINPNKVVTDVEKLEGGFVSGQIYRAKTRDMKSDQEKIFYIKYLRTKPILVSKGRTYGEEANLHYLAQASHLKSIQQHIDIILPIASYEYQVKDGRKVFMILPSAEGESLSKLTQSNNLTTINQAFAVLGSALGKVHLSYQFFSGPNGSKTPQTKQDFINVCVPSHGDLHGDNVFYNPSTERIAFIDVETMANSFDEKDQANSPLCYDMLYMILMSSKKFGDFMPKNNWAPFLNMFKSYVEVYPLEQRQGLYDYLIYCLQRVDKIEFIDIFKYFNFTKKFGKSEIKGANTLIANLMELRREHLKQINRGRDYSKEFKDAVETAHSPKNSPNRLRAVTAPSSPSPNGLSLIGQAKLPLPFTPQEGSMPLKVNPLSVTPKVINERNKDIPFSKEPYKGIPLPNKPKEVSNPAKVIPLSVPLKGVSERNKVVLQHVPSQDGEVSNKITRSPVISKITAEPPKVVPFLKTLQSVGATPKVGPLTVMPTAVAPNKVIPFPIAPKVGKERDKAIPLNNMSGLSTTPPRQDISDLRKRFESFSNPGSGKILSTKKN